MELLGRKGTTKRLLLDFMSLLFTKSVQQLLLKEVERQLAKPRQDKSTQQLVNHQHERQRQQQQTQQKKPRQKAKDAAPPQRRSDGAPTIPPAAAASRAISHAADQSRSSRPAVHVTLSLTQTKAMLQLINDTLTEVGRKDRLGGCISELVYGVKWFTVVVLGRCSYCRSELIFVLVARRDLLLLD